MGFSSNGGDGPVANINVTPLVDVMLVLLVIFDYVSFLLFQVLMCPTASSRAHCSSPRSSYF